MVTKMEVKTVQLLSLIKPQHKRWVALFFLFCAVIPFLGLMGFSIYTPAPAVDRPATAENTRPEKTPVQAGTKAKEAPTAESAKARQNPSTTAYARQEERPTTASTPGTANHQTVTEQPDPVDLNLLARVIYAEARGEPLEGQVAVGAVLINRVNSPYFPDDLWSIVFKKGEFCTVRDGQIWLQPDATAYRAARLAKAGWDPTNGALYFYNPKKTTSAWIWSRTVTTRIGRHVFAV